MNLTSEQKIYETSCRILGATHFIVANALSEELLINHIFAIVFNGFLIIPTILLNTVAIITIWKSSQMRSKPCYFIILVQSAVDLAVGVVSIPLFIFYLWTRLAGNVKYCYVAFFAFRLTFLPLGSSSIILTALTLERYIAIVHPYSYNTEVTKKRLLLFIGSFFVIEFCVFTLSLGGIQSLLELYAVVKMTLVLLFIAFSYTKIYLVVRKISRSQCKPQDPSSNENLTRMKLFLREIRQAKACFIVVICFCALSFLPTITTIPFAPVFDKFEELAIQAWIVTFGLLNSSLNTVIFFWTKTMLKKEAFKIFKRS